MSQAATGDSNLLNLNVELRSWVILPFHITAIIMESRVNKLIDEHVIQSI